MARKFEVQSYASAAKTEITVSYDHYNSISLCNTHASNAVSVDLWVTSQVGTDITTTGVYAAETEAASTSSVTLTVDNGSGSASAGTSDMFLNEQVWKSDGTLFGTCTTFGSTTSLTFSGGLGNAITDNDILFTGTRYYILNNVEIPNGTTLKLSGDEFLFNRDEFNLYITPTVAASVQTILR